MPGFPIPSSANAINFDSILQLFRTPQESIFQSPALQNLQGFFGASSTGGLSPQLEQLFNLGAQKIRETGSQNLAALQSQNQGRGRAGSSVAASQEAQLQTGTEQNLGQLFASLIQNQLQANQAYGGLLFQGAGQDTQVHQQLLTMLLDVMTGKISMDEAKNQFDQYRSLIESEGRANRIADIFSSIIKGGATVAGGYLGRK